MTSIFPAIAYNNGPNEEKQVEEFKKTSLNGKLKCYQGTICRGPGRRPSALLQIFTQLEPVKRPVIGTKDSPLALTVEMVMIFIFILCC
jgi:hypothetical protein